MNLEQQLRRALQRKDPPSGFHDKVLSRIAAGETVRTPATIRRWPRVALPIAASLMLAFGGTYYIHRQQDGRRANSGANRARRARGRPGSADRKREDFVDPGKKYRRSRDMTPRILSSYCLIMATLLVPRPALAQGAKLQLDHLNKLAEKLTETVDVSADTAMLKQAAGFLAGKGSDTEKMQQLLGGITGIYVKSSNSTRPTCMPNPTSKPSASKYPAQDGRASSAFAKKAS